MKNTVQKKSLALISGDLFKLTLTNVVLLVLILATHSSFATPPTKVKTSIKETAHTLTPTTEHFTGDADGTTSFTGPGGEDFQLTGNISVDSNPGDGTTGDDQWAGTARNTYLNNAVGSITLCEATKAFQVTEIDCWTSINGGANYAVGDVTFIGYLHGGGTVSYTTTVTPTDDATGYDPVSFSGTALDGVNLRSLQFVLPGAISYLGVDAFDYSITSGLSSYNSSPTVSSVALSGNISKGSTMTGSHTYHDCDNTESGTSYQWYRSDDASGTNKGAISGATSSTYDLTFDDVGKYITYEVTPSDGTSSGVASSSTYYGPITCGIDAYDEDFEDNSGTTFTNNGQGFTVSGSNAGIVTFSDYGWNGSAKDDRYIDNDADLDANDGAEISITTTDGADILVRSFYVYCSEDDYTRSASSNLTVTGKKDNVTEFTFTKSSGFNTTSTNNGFNFIDLSTEGGSDNSNTLIDELILSTTGAFDYLAIDALDWATQNFTTAFLTTSSISTFDATTATMGGEVTDDGCVSVTENGVVYNTTGSPTVSDTKVSISTGVGSYSQSISGLSASTQYYIRSYAINAEGTTYGSEETFTTSAALPVEILSFVGSYEDKAVKLRWETSSEFLNKGYHIMRRTKSEEWQEIGFVKAQEVQQGLLSYQYIDEFNLHDTNLYYQLAQEDMDGSMQYSRVVLISRDWENNISLYPNPAKDLLTISSTQYDLKQFQLYDLQGRLVAKQKLETKEATIDLRNFPKGYYTVIIRLNGSQKVIKRLTIQ